ncbi:TPM domain-containing protein [Cupriavidus gilardii]|uniref:TPM domain-containing protein n=1 Tax=Cupriavidus gilardii TaxID=82541 RepID=UPI00157472F1|nr:TPM domain-containing protein [Cupriavidus gilardii]MCG5262893.1 TPM domain-containing protein [Cupriavidus gilardii]MDF9432117.1 TPM domain-containing protein [Cupriavidus gilardii]NSX06882.1 TPM domain-containing protein [Cupriavidus gilardii]
MPTRSPPRSPSPSRGLRRALRHALTPVSHAHRHFPPDALAQLQRAVREGERQHRGEVRVVIESSLPATHAWAGVTPRERARALFAALEVWDTVDHTGVLLYINLADHAVELLADRGIDARVDRETWSALCQSLAHGLARDLSIEPVLATVAQIHALLARHFPQQGDGNPNELDDRPIVL